MDILAVNCNYNKLDTEKSFVRSVFYDNQKISVFCCLFCHRSADDAIAVFVPVDTISDV